ncbi:type 1 periplasmic-binding domain-containing protein [Streptomyces spongiae]|uniref:ABC transporter substrate-binding protein n=1 Tax=Streptomyces spongiae TaxID=565072 RepID=A0A5N8XXD2_9ACTN|nr:ABC transporter substrate-binding protein [Streptomyces spongiae]MPY63932.1 ABC transporter substrate-binding protein [Streptomyces spongiae]
MPSTPSASPPDGFPDDRASDFVRDFRTTVAPEYGSRAGLETNPPLFILRLPETAYPSGVDRVVKALIDALHQNGRRVPYAHLPAGDDSELLSVSAGVQLRGGTPDHMTPDRYPNFLVMRDLVAYVRANPTAWANEPQAKQLRTYAAEQRASRGGVLAFTRMEGPQLDGIAGFLAGLSWLSFVQRLPRWVWARWTSRRVMRRWLGAEQVAAGSTKLFRVMDELGAVRRTQLMNEPDHPEALQEFDWLVLRALLEDLSRPAVGRFLPGRRRRTARPVMIVEVPPPGTRGARAAERFLRSLHRAHTTAQPPGPLVVAVGRPSDDLLGDLGRPENITLPEASLQLTRRGGPPVLVTFGEEALAGPGLHIPLVAPKTFRFSRRVPTSIASGVTALALVAAGVLWKNFVAQDYTCRGGTDSVAEAAPGKPVPVDAAGWYKAAADAIDVQNKRARGYARQGRTVRTVVVYVSKKPETVDETRFDGTIPELRGIAMWQEQLNDDAASNTSLVPLIVDVQETGEGFRDAEAKAEELVARVGRERAGANNPDKVVGVLAYAQSREETRDALQVLGQARIPTVGTTATADEMVSDEAGFSYWPFTPNNSREAGIEADFARRTNIVARHGSENECVPAAHAIVIESSADLYSRSLAARFTEDFPGTEQVFNFNQEGDFTPAPPAGTESLTSADVLARRICEALEQEPESVVYWSARARDFTAFVNSMHREGTCTTDDITVLGGNELTNVAQTGVFKDKDWLRLYYSAHRLPSTDDRASAKTRQFVDDYVEFVERTTKGPDPWRQDGHSAVSYDAFHVLSQAVADALQAKPDVSRELVLAKLQNGVRFDGATGFVGYAEDVHSPPVDKTLVLLRQLGNQPEAVLACGAYAQGTSSAKQGPPCSAKAAGD